jgi:hypothetical protein
MKEAILFDHACCSCPTPSQRSKQLRSFARIPFFVSRTKTRFVEEGLREEQAREGRQWRRRRRHEEAQELG